MAVETQVTVLHKVVVKNALGKTVSCTNVKGGCFNFVYNKCSDGVIRCQDCGTNRALVDGLVESPFPRPRMEYWDRFNQLPNYSFLLDSSNSVRKVPMKSGNWKEGYEVGLLIEEMQAEINSLRDRLERLEPKAV